MLLSEFEIGMAWQHESINMDHHAFAAFVQAETLRRVADYCRTTDEPTVEHIHNWCMNQVEEGGK